MAWKAFIPAFVYATIWVAAHASATDELLATYNAPQALAMGNALTADAAGFAALFHNPAGLAKAGTREAVFTPLAVEGTFSGSFLQTAASAQSFSINRLMGTIQSTPGAYQYLRATALPSYTRRGFGVALLASHESAAISDGTALRGRSGSDYGVFIGAASNFAANMIKVGVTGKALLRHELRGEFAHTSLGNDAAIASQMREGIGFGADLGMMVTLPVSYLPTLGFTWNDVGNTGFIGTGLLDATSAGAPERITQSFNVAVSAHPALGRGVRALVTAEFKHIERTDLPLRKRLHFGFQMLAFKRLYIWGGLNQFFPTGGIGYRVQGGDLEVGTFAQDVGQGAEIEGNRRFFMRYTVSF